jgi:hypothetical protein
MRTECLDGGDLFGGEDLQHVQLVRDRVAAYSDERVQLSSRLVNQAG